MDVFFFFVLKVFFESVDKEREGKREKLHDEKTHVQPRTQEPPDKLAC